MSAEMAQKLVQGGIKAVRNGDHDLARKAFTQALKLDPYNEAAWLGMATITDGNDDKLRILQRVLEINPDNSRAQEAMRRIEGDTPSADPEPQAEPDPIADEGMVASDLFDDDDDIVTAELPSDVVDSATSVDDGIYSTGEIQPLTDMPVGDTGELSDFPIPDWSLDEDIPGIDDAKAREPEIILRSSDEVFSNLPQMPSNGTGGVPQLPETAVVASGEIVEADVQAYLEESLATYLDEDTPFVRKERGRAGSSEYRSFLLQAGTATVVALAIVFGGLISFLLSNPATARVLLGSTNTPAPTATNTPTATPGVTNTPSPMPDFEPSSTPELPFQATLGFDDPNFPPTPTQAYYPNSVNPISVGEDTFMLINDGELEAARELLEEGVFIEEETGEFSPTYRLSQWHLLNDDPETAREIIVDWQEEWQERDFSDYLNAEALVLIGLARVDVYEITNGASNRFELLDNAQANLERALGLVSGAEVLNVPDPLNPEGYVLLAQIFELRGNTEQALETLNSGLQLEGSGNQLPLIGNTDMRMEAVRILANERRYDEAFQELYYVLEFDPFLEEALILQTELALEAGEAGLGVLYAQQYLLYYPGSLQGLYLLGQAREAENKFDLALDAYSRAVAGDTSVESYVSDPFFLDNLLARATLLTQQGREEEAAEDFALASELVSDDPAIRARSLAASFIAEDYTTVLSVADEVLGERGVNRAQVFYYQGLALIAQRQAGGGTGSNYADAITALNNALDAGLTGLQRTIAQENLAIANLEQRNFDDALTAINDAIAGDATADRIYLRAQILDAQGNVDEALLDYEFLVTWGDYFNLPFLDEVRTAYDRATQRSELR